MKNHLINVEWTMAATLEIEASTRDEAIDEAHAGTLPDGDYVSDSFVVIAQEENHDES